MDTAEVWRSIFENWPETIPREGYLVTSFNEHIPFNGFLVSGGVLLVDRDKPDTYGSRKVMVAYSAILAIKITNVIELGRFQVMGFQRRSEVATLWCGRTVRYKQDASRKLVASSPPSG